MSYPYMVLGHATQQQLWETWYDSFDLILNPIQSYNYPASNVACVVSFAGLLVHPRVISVDVSMMSRPLMDGVWLLRGDRARISCAQEKV